MKPLAIDLFCGLGGWTEGLLTEGYRVIGFDIEAHAYGDERYPAELVLADVLELHGSRFADADLIVASPPCQEYSYMAMPWKLAKAKAAAIRADETGAALVQLNRLFEASFRIQREACAAAGRHIPLVVENVRGAIPWVGQSRWNYGSFHLWGDVPALMLTGSHVKVPSFRFDGSGRSFQSESVRRTAPGNGARFTTRDCGLESVNLAKMGFNVAAARAYADDVKGKKYQRTESDKRSHIGITRKYAAARIAKIPLPLSRYIAAHYRPRQVAA